MTPADLIAELRDVHLPPPKGDAGWFLSPTPLLIFAALLACGYFWARWRASAWRREGAARLAAARGVADEEARWAALTVLYRQTSRKAGAGGVPDYLFQPRAALGPDADGRLSADIERHLR